MYTQLDTTIPIFSQLFWFCVRFNNNNSNTLGPFPDMFFLLLNQPEIQQALFFLLGNKMC